jgi:hypothetical protein
MDVLLISFIDVSLSLWSVFLLYIIKKVRER